MIQTFKLTINEIVFISIECNKNENIEKCFIWLIANSLPRIEKFSVIKKKQYLVVNRCDSIRYFFLSINQNFSKELFVYQNEKSLRIVDDDDVDFVIQILERN